MAVYVRNVCVLHDPVCLRVCHCCCLVSWLAMLRVVLLVKCCRLFSPFAVACFVAVGVLLHAVVV